MAAAHTPGPWIVTHEDYGTVIRGAEIEREEHGTKFEFRDYVGATWGHRSDTSDANARLMAAAPELLEALQSVLSGAVHYQLRDGEQCVLDARTAIAKATGGAL